MLTLNNCFASASKGIVRVPGRVPLLTWLSLFAFSYACPAQLSLTCWGNKTITGNPCAVALANPTCSALHAFGVTNADGRNSVNGFVQAGDGTLYGVTGAGGSAGLGTVFKVNPDGTGYQVLVNFTGTGGAAAGRSPEAALLIASDGNLYGVTAGGGASADWGVLFRMTTGGAYTPLHNFNNTDGWAPETQLVQAPDGMIYGPTTRGGSSGQGVVFRWNPTNATFAVLHSFSGSEGSSGAGLTWVGGILYGTCSFGGASGLGTLFSLNPSSPVSLNVLHIFTGPSGDGQEPDGNLTLASDGWLYGTTRFGGTSGLGTVYRVSTGGSYSVLKSFSGADGANPQARVIEGCDGALYGTTRAGGASNDGTVFKVNKDSSGAQVLWSFSTNSSTGTGPLCDLLFDTAGSVYGTTVSGGAGGAGTVFRLDGVLGWSFDLPGISDFCATSAVVIASTTVTNSVCPWAMTRTWVVSDACGYSNTCSQSVNVTCGSPPVLVCPPDKIVQCGSLYDFEDPTATDCLGTTNVAMIILSTTTNGPDCAQVITRTWLGTDCYNLTATCSQTFVVTNSPPPAITQQPQSQRLAVGANASFSVTATSALPLTYAWYFNGIQTGSSSNFLSIAPAQVANAGNYWVVVQDAYGAMATSQVAHLYVQLPSPPSGLSLSLSNNQGAPMLTISDDGSLPYSWQLQSTTNLGRPTWVAMTNGIGNAQFLIAAGGGAKFFRLARLIPPSQSDDLQSIFGGLPQDQFNTGLLGGALGQWYPSIPISDGTLIDPNLPIDTNRLVSGSDFLLAYNTLRASALHGGPILPDFSEMKVTINPASQPIRLGDNLAFQQIQALAAAVIPYNTIDTNAFNDQRLMLLDSNGIPIDISNTNVPPNVPPYSVAQGPNSGAYIQTNVFAGVGLFRDVIQIGNGPTTFLLPKEFLVAPDKVVSVQIRFPGVPLLLTNFGTNLVYDGFVNIVPDKPFQWDFSAVNRDSTGVARIPLVLRVTVLGDNGLATAGQFDLDAATVFILRTLPDLAGTYCHDTVTDYYYPEVQPGWWPTGEWIGKPGDPKKFFTGAKPGWWPSFIPWPCPYDSYNAEGTLPVSIIYTVVHLGIFTHWVDRQAWGPFWSPTKGANSGPQDPAGDNWADGYNMRLYPATCRNRDPDRCHAHNLVLIVDGIDTRPGGNARTEEDLWNDFGAEGRKLLDKGYDILVLNYVHGDDYIQRNAFALLEVLKDYVPGYAAPGYENDRVAIVCASMGTQVTRYALVAAEQLLYPEKYYDHKTGLAIYLDAPFLGANLPWSMQSLLWFLSYNSVKASDAAKHSLNDVLLSPAARQLLRASVHYAPDPLNAAFYSEMAGYLNNGLPYLARNAAVSCGSGAGFSLKNTVGTFSATSFASLSKFAILSALECGFIDVAATAEGPTQPSSQQRVLSVSLRGSTPALACIPIIKHDSLNCYIQAGARPSDLSPGGATGLAQTIVDEYNNAAGPLAGMSGFPVNTFIPLFSALYVRSAETNVAQEQIQASEVHDDGSVNPISGYRKHVDFWYAPELGGQIDPATPTKSPLDAIWYQYTNVSHVISWDTNGVGELLPPGYEAFVLNELDQFTANEPFTSESVLTNQPTIPMHESYLIGDLVDDSTAELLTINTFAPHAMVQSFEGGAWQTLWADYPGSGWISQPQKVGDWPIRKGDKFFLARLTGGKKLLVSISGTPPATAMVQQLSNTGGVYSWSRLWVNDRGFDFPKKEPSGLLGPFHLRSTDLYAFGDVLGTGTNEQLLVTYPYVCNDERERVTPGTSGLSPASVLVFGITNASGGYGWTEVWNNAANIDTIGATYVRFGDRLMFGHVANSLGDWLFSVNQLPGIFGGSAYLQQYFPCCGWESYWTDHGTTSQQCNCASYGYGPGNFGCWTNGVRDRYYFADLDGDGLDELICASDTAWHAYTWGGSSSQWCLMPYFTDASHGSSTLGSYPLRIGDRFFFGNLDGLAPGDEVLVVNPVDSCPTCPFRTFQVMIQRWTPSGWQVVWQSNGDRFLGNWPLYQDLP